MRFWDDDCLHLGLDDAEPFNPLLAGGSTPLTDEEVASIEALCEMATRGPLVIDDQASGEGVVVATLPDGRHIVSLAPDDPSDDPKSIEANAQLIRQARCLLLRLLRDRDRWHMERDELLERMHSLDGAMAPEGPYPKGLKRRLSSIPR